MKFVQRSARFALPLLTLACWWTMPSPAAVMVSVVQSFDGIGYGGSNTNSAALPPDCNGAAGPNHFVEFINGVFAVYNKTSGTQMEFKTDVDFWASARV